MEKHRCSAGVESIRGDFAVGLFFSLSKVKVIDVGRACLVQMLLATSLISLSEMTVLLPNSLHNLLPLSRAPLATSRDSDFAD
eukprot:3536506-Rhodomonas_salina.2